MSKSRHGGEGGFRPLAKIALVPFQVRALLQHGLHPAWRWSRKALGAAPANFWNPASRANWRAASRNAFTLSGAPAAVEVFGPGLERDSQLQPLGILQVHRQAHDRVVGDAAGPAQFFGQLTTAWVRKLPNCLSASWV